MRNLALTVAIGFAAAGCESKTSTTDRSETQPHADPATKSAAQAQLADLTTASNLAPVRAAFNAKKGEARFLTLLSPT